MSASIAFGFSIPERRVFTDLMSARRDFGGPTDFGMSTDGTDEKKSVPIVMVRTGGKLKNYEDCRDLLERVLQTLKGELRPLDQEWVDLFGNDMQFQI